MDMFDSDKSSQLFNKVNDIISTQVDQLVASQSSVQSEQSNNELFSRPRIQRTKTSFEVVSELLENLSDYFVQFESKSRNFENFNEFSKRKSVFKEKHYLMEAKLSEFDKVIKDFQNKLEKEKEQKNEMKLQLKEVKNSYSLVKDQLDTLCIEKQELSKLNIQLIKDLEEAKTTFSLFSQPSPLKETKSPERDMENLEIPTQLKECLAQISREISEKELLAKQLAEFSTKTENKSEETIKKDNSLSYSNKSIQTIEEIELKKPRSTTDMKESFRKISERRKDAIRSQVLDSHLGTRISNLEKENCFLKQKLSSEK
ncbi:MAG: hypothetical protein MHPSP_000170 [Paramarteilia canceri]